MNIHESWSELMWFLMIYSFLGWTLEVCIYAVTAHRFVNRGLSGYCLCPGPRR